LVEEFKQKLLVDKNIVPLLSKSTYLNSFAHATREMVSNSYDADALKVEISIDKKLKDISIKDDGNGMSKDEFIHYCTIAGQKRHVKLSRKFRRKRIGLFGIGFLSIFPFCEKLKIITKVENSDQILTATIPSKNYFVSEIEQKLEDIEFSCTIREDGSLRRQHFTHILLKNPTYYLKKYFSKIKSRERNTVLVWDPFEKYKWELQEDLPLTYEKGVNFPKASLYSEPIGISVYLNGEPLYRNKPLEITLEEGKSKIDDLEYKFFISTNYKSISPKESRGIKMRINNVGIGARTDFELSKERGFSRLHWLNGEIDFSENIKEYLNINRDSFILDPSLENLFIDIKDKLKKQAYFVDDVAVAEKEIESIFSNDRSIAQVRAKKEIVDKNIDILKSKGFRVLDFDAENSKALKKIKNLSPIQIDKKDKLISIINPDDIYHESQRIFDKEYYLVYNKWDIDKTKFPSCRFLNQNTIEINEDYPLFKSRQYGNMFKKFHILLLIACEKSSNNKEMFELIMKEFPKEFENF